MKMETVFLDAVIIVATLAAIIEFALFEWEGVRKPWHRARGARRGRGNGRPPKGGSRRRLGLPWHDWSGEK